MTIPDHITYLRKAIHIAEQSEKDGNIPVGAVITLDDKIISEGNSSVLSPEYNPGRHAEIEAIKKVPVALWPHASEMTCYTTLEPCVMCFSTMLLHGIGHIVFGAWDKEGGCSAIIDHLPVYYKDGHGVPQMSGPLLPEECDPLYERTIKLFDVLPCGKIKNSKL